MRTLSFTSVAEPFSNEAPFSIGGLKPVDSSDATDDIDSEQGASDGSGYEADPSNVLVNVFGSEGTRKGQSGTHSSLVVEVAGGTFALYRCPQILGVACRLNKFSLTSLLCRSVPQLGHTDGGVGVGLDMMTWPFYGPCYSRSYLTMLGCCISLANRNVELQVLQCFDRKSRGLF